jgi:hypothetical protein
MSALVLRLWVLLLAILFQVSNWNAAAQFWANAAVWLARGAAETDGGRDESRGSDSRDRPARDWEMPEDGTKELTAVDDVAGNDGVPAEFPSCCNPAPCDCGYAWADGLSPGGAPPDVPFKPPRA